ncbi:MAG: type IV secretory system conjugative DNA transfer family protein, partial [Chloroflexi bacterium]|nr:type IV secretory system conjugative DNA transfer family protein [Chloroflexota bacterium]
MAWAALLFGDVRLASAWPHLQSYLVAADPGRLDDFWRAAFRGAWPWLSAAGSWPWWATHALVALVGFGLWSWTGSWWNPLLDRPTRATASDVHGSARWRTQAEIERTLRPVRMDAPEAAGVVVGSTSGRAWLTRPEVGNPHTLVVGATRSGKTRRMILPSVWAIGHAGESMVISDPKGELHAMTSAWLRERGYQVVQLDLLRPGRGNRWNPFAAIEAAHASGDDEEAARLAWEFGDVMSSETGIGTDPIWPAAEQSLMAALALGTVLEAPEGFRHPATAFRILYDLGEDGGGRLDAWFAQLGADHPARAAAATAMLAESRTRASIYAGTSARMRLFGEPGVAWLTAQSDHDPADAGRRPMAIFLLL